MTTPHTTKPNAELSEMMKLMSRVNDSFSFSIDIPSRNDTVPFRPITTAQQKTLIKSSLDMTGTSSDFIYNLRNIIRDNCADPDIDADNLTILDKLFICMKLRINSIGPQIKIQLNEYLEDEETPVTLSLNLVDFYEKMLQSYKGVLPTTIKDDDGNYIVECDIPTIGEEYRIDKELQKEIKERLIDSETADYAQGIYTELFIQELGKYVKTISIRNLDNPDNPEDYIVTDLKNVPFETRLKFIDMLPNALSEEIVNYANDTIDGLNSLLIAEIPVNGKVIKYNLEVATPAFFIRS